MNSIEWLIEQLRQLAHNDKHHLGMGDIRITQGMLDDFYEQAKEMHKQEIENAYNKCYQDLSNTQKEVDKLATYVSKLPQQEISDEEIEKGAINFCIKNIDEEIMHWHDIFVSGAKWYREQLKQKK